VAGVSNPQFNGTYPVAIIGTNSILYSAPLSFHATGTGGTVSVAAVENSNTPRRKPQIPTEPVYGWSWTPTAQQFLPAPEAPDTLINITGAGWRALRLGSGWARLVCLLRYQNANGESAWDFADLVFQHSGEQRV